MTTAEREVAERPVGRDAVRAAVFEAAASLFAARGLSAVSIRDVAKRAGVNHGLLHRHFGEKSELVREVMGHLADALARDVDADAVARWSGPEPLLRIIDSPYFRMLAYALLEGHDPAELQASFPFVSRMVSAVEHEQRAGTIDAQLDARLLVAVGVAAGLGWVLFEPFLLTATGLGHRAPKQTRARALALCTELASVALRRHARPPTRRGRHT